MYFFIYFNEELLIFHRNYSELNNELFLLFQMQTCQTSIIESIEKK